MTRIDIAELTHFLNQLRATNQEVKPRIEAVKQAVIAYLNDNTISGEAIAVSKDYYAGAYIPLCASIKQALNLSEDLLRRYITDFHSQVDMSPNARLDADGIFDLDQKINGFENRMGDVTAELSAINGTQKASELNYLATQIFEAHKKEEILRKLLDFERSHANYFYELGELSHFINRAVRDIQQNLKFNSKTGTYNIEKLTPATFEHLVKMYATQQEIDDKIKAIEEIGLTPNIPTGNSAGFMTNDGKVDTEATLNFVNQQMIYWQNETVFREVLGVGAFYRAVYGVDSVSGERISAGMRLVDGATVAFQYGAPALGLARFTAKFGTRTSLAEINALDRAKLSGWGYPPNEAKYLRYKVVYDNPKYYDQKTGAINWPPNNGFEGIPVKQKIEPGKIIDRYGEPENAYFTSPDGILYEQRALALHSDEANYYRYKIVKPFVVDSGKAAPWFDRVGGGTQYFSGESKILNKKGELIDATVENLLDNNYIREID